ncbi:ABC transporter permease [Agaribacterium sp. ZY112]|uniref:ABC transporter permease n=1 Tax=Agaribacterium sp. ZY112 TaxID=3233574 RepID=UPI00352374C2
MSVFVAFFLFSSLSGINTALTASFEDIDRNRLITSHKISLSQSLPINYKQKLERIHGLSLVTYSTWFGGFFKDEKGRLAALAVDNSNYFDVFDEYLFVEGSLQRWQEKRNGVVVGKALAERHGWVLGQSLRLGSSIWMTQEGSFTWDFEIVAVVKANNNLANDERVLLRHDYFDDVRAYGPYTASWFSSLVDDGVDLNQLVSIVDKQFMHSSYETRSSTEQAFAKEQAQQFVDMAVLIRLVSAAVFFTLLLIVCNTTGQSVRDRINELAMMKALGFSSFDLIRLVYLESLLLLTAAAFWGLLSAHVAIVVFASYSNGFLPGMSISVFNYLVVFSLVNITALICVLLTAFNIKKLKITQSLGEGL